MNLAEKIYMLRTQANLSQAALAEKLNVSRQTVSKWELDASYPEIDKVVALSDLFHVSTDYLLKNAEPNQDETNLDRLVLRFLGYSQDMEVISKDLVEIMKDGIIDKDERSRMKVVVGKLNEVSAMIEEIRFGLHNNGID